MNTLAREQFNRQAAQYNNQWAQWSDETLRRMLELAQPQPTWRVLDVATGTGFTALAFAPHVSHVTGVDVSPGMLAQAEARAQEQNIHNVTWAEAPAETLPFADGSFECVTVRIAPHHFTDVGAFLREARRVLVNGGVFLLGDTTVPDGNTEAADWQNAVEKERDPSHNANLSPDTWRTLTQNAGFTVTDCETRTGAIPLVLSAWLHVAGCDEGRAARVRQMFTDAPASVQQAFRVTRNTNGETLFAWQRVILRAQKEAL